MKKLLSLALSAALLCTLGAPALAAQTSDADARLTAVTEKVKAALGLDTAGYDAFSGDLNEGAVTPTWNLSWSGDGVGLSITATESGKILSYNRYESQEEFSAYPGRRFGPAFPKLTRADAQITAQAFLDKVLAAGVETARFEEVATSTLSAASHSFHGGVLEHGLPSPFSFRVSVRVSDNTVTSFYLGGGQENYLGGVPSPAPAVAGVKAGEDLKTTLKLYPEYVLEQDGKTAVLRYLPAPTHTFYVDAQTGKTVDLTALQQELWERGGAAEAPAPNAAPESTLGSKDTASLTEAELQGVAHMEGVLPKEALDAAARKYTALGLGKYTLSTAGYRVDKEEGQVTAALQFAYKNDKGVYRRNVTLNAKTGALLSVYSSRPWVEGEKPALTEARSQARAEAFLKEVCPAQFARTARYENPAADGAVYRSANDMAPSFTYAANENGYFLADSSLTVGVDASDGSVSSYHNNYRDDISFQNPAGMVDMAGALSAWFGTYHVTLGYLAVPEKLDLSQPDYKPLLEMGRNFLHTQKLAYSLTRSDWYEGVDAMTGLPVKAENTARSAVAYGDLTGHWVKAQAEALAQYGVGWLGGSLRPDAALTQLDLVALLVSTDGYLYDANEKDAADRIYSMAYSMGILERKDRADTAPVTRAGLTKLLLDGAGYGSIAGLEGIFRCAFSDQASIPAEYYGYAAVAQALGLVKGDAAGAFAPARPASRAEAVGMVYNFMSR